MYSPKFGDLTQFKIKYKVIYTYTAPNLTSSRPITNAAIVKVLKNM